MSRKPHVYLIHSTEALTKTHKNGKPFIVHHYIGTTRRDPQRRYAEHNGSGGAKICQAFRSKGGQLIVTRTWAGSYSEEKLVKSLHNAKVLCPMCNPRAMKRRPHKLMTKGRRANVILSAPIDEEIPF